MRARAGFFYGGVFLLCLTTLVLQILQTRILSVISYYHLTFFAISMAMLGMTAGALRVYLARDPVASEDLEPHLARITAWYAVSIVVCAGFELASAAETVPGAMAFFIWAKMILTLAIPFFFAGMAVSLALTRSRRPVGIVYGVDLAGAASGCLAAVLLLGFLDGPSALIATAVIAAVASACFAAAGGASARSASLPGGVTVASALRIAAALAAFCVWNASTPDGLQPVFSKGALDPRDRFEFERWNSFSRIVAYHSETRAPFAWGPSPLMPTDVPLEQHWVNIDGDAATAMPRFDGDLSKFDYLNYDVTTLAYNIRHQGRAAVIGVGGGRDMLSAYYFGFLDVTGVELNPIFVDLLTNPRLYRGFSGIADFPGVRFFVDDARSWFARSTERFDLIQMSLVDTWAATGAGGFTLSENGLYTTEGWLTFLRHLTPTGVFTVSRWYAPGDEEQTGRVISLAMAALYELGVEDPKAHLFLAGQGKLSTIVISRAPLTAADIAGLRGAADRYRHKVLLAPDATPSQPVFRDLIAARSIADLETRAASYMLDFSPATDARPFFFNVLRLSPVYIWQAYQMRLTGVVHGNLIASITVLVIIVLSALFVGFVILLPALGAVRGVERRLAIAGTSYFLLIGLGFMLVEIAIIQRISVFLGHPVYALSIGLFSIILSTGLGSFMSEIFVLSTRRRLVGWAVLLALYLACWPLWFPALASAFEASEIAVRGLACVLAIMPAGILMGFGFPTGMRLANAVDARPTPWFWGINGAAGVLGAGIAVGCSITTSIDVTLRLGAVAYLVLAAAAIWLRGSKASGAAQIEMALQEPAIGG
ncbi:MAG TPA: hypothetical protein VET85_09595 [Stellaceae bacterium]|nr:hypothetical protein [Stellaceae bacterium]